MADFTFETTPRILCEDGAAARLGALAAEYGMKRPVVVTDPGLVRAGVLAPAEQGLRAAGMSYAVYSDVQADPPEARVLEAVAFARRHGADGVVGVGGGSSMDTAKLVALLARTDQPIQEAYGIDKARGPRLPLLQVPTTAGTGSEATPIAVVTSPRHEKLVVVSRLLYPDAAVLDASLTLGLPPAVTAMTGVDAMTHAIEAFTSRHKGNALSEALAVKAMQLLFPHLRRAVRDGSDRAARAAMLQGSLLAGMSFANAPVAAVHALSYPIGGHYGVPHGHAIALALVPVLEHNLPAAAGRYAELGAAILPGRRFAGAEEGGRAFVDAMRDLVAEMPFAHRLSQVGVPESALPGLAAEAAAIQRLIQNNPRAVGDADALAMYRSIY